MYKLWYICILQKIAKLYTETFIEKKLAEESVKLYLRFLSNELLRGIVKPIPKTNYETRIVVSILN